MDIVKRKMIEFVKSKGQTLSGGKTIYNKQVPTVVPKAQPQNQTKIQASIPENETPKERLARKKREEADKKAEQLSQAAKEAQ